MSTVYEELFPNGVGKISEELYATVKSLCAVAQEVRELRLYQTDRDELLDQQRARFDQEEGERLEQEAEERRKQAAIMRDSMKSLLPMMQDVRNQIVSPLDFSAPPLGYGSLESQEKREALQKMVCECGHLKQSHDKDGCIVCDCKLEQPTPRNA